MVVLNASSVVASIVSLSTEKYSIHIKSKIIENVSLLNIKLNSWWTDRCFHYLPLHRPQYFGQYFLVWGQSQACRVAILHNGVSSSHFLSVKTTNEYRWLFEQHFLFCTMYAPKLKDISHISCLPFSVLRHIPGAQYSFGIFKSFWQRNPSLHDPRLSKFEWQIVPCGVYPQVSPSFFNSKNQKL